MSAMQPQPMPAMTVAGNRNVKNLPVGPEGREWSNGLCGCLGAPGTCTSPELLHIPFLIILSGLVSWCCPCITYGRNKRRYEHLNSRGTPDPEHGGLISSDCLLHGCISVVGFGWVMEVGLGINSFPQSMNNFVCSSCFVEVLGDVTTSKEVPWVIAVLPVGASLVRSPKSLGRSSLKRKLTASISSFVWVNGVCWV